MLLVLRVGEHLEQVLVAPGSPAVLGRAGARAGRADDRSLEVGGNPLDGDVVLPVVAEVVPVDELAADGGDGPEGRAAFVDGDHLVLGVRHAFQPKAIWRT